MKKSVVFFREQWMKGDHWHIDFFLIFVKNNNFKK